MTWHYLWKELLDPFFPALNSFLVTVFLKNLDPKILLKDPLFFFFTALYIYIYKYIYGSTKNLLSGDTNFQIKFNEASPQKRSSVLFFGLDSFDEAMDFHELMVVTFFPKTCENLGPSKCFRFRVGLLLLSWVGWNPAGKTPPEDELTLGTWNWWIWKIRISSSRGVFWGSTLIFQYTLED